MRWHCGVTLIFMDGRDIYTVLTGYMVRKIKVQGLLRICWCFGRLAGLVYEW